MWSNPKIARSPVKGIKCLDSKLGLSIVLLAGKGLIMSPQDIDLYSGAIKARSTRSARLCTCICKTEFLNNILPYSLLLNLSFSLKNFQGLNVILHYFVSFIMIITNAVCFLLMFILKFHFFNLNLIYLYVDIIIKLMKTKSKHLFYYSKLLQNKL